ncbi:recombinase family protein, partial [Klebsiella pneumoniae]
MGSCAAPSAKGDDKFITTDYLQQCQQIYQDQTSRSGPKRDKKGALELENCLKALREGDTLVVWALDRLGGSLGQVITLLDDLKKRGITFIAIKD